MIKTFFFIFKNYVRLFFSFKRISATEDEQKKYIYYPRLTIFLSFANHYKVFDCSELVVSERCSVYAAHTHACDETHTVYCNFCALVLTHGQ